MDMAVASIRGQTIAVEPDIRMHARVIGEFPGAFVPFGGENPTFPDMLLCPALLLVPSFAVREQRQDR